MSFLIEKSNPPLVLSFDDYREKLLKEYKECEKEDTNASKIIELSTNYKLENNPVNIVVLLNNYYDESNDELYTDLFKICLQKMNTDSISFHNFKTPIAEYSLTDKHIESLKKWAQFSHQTNLDEDDEVDSKSENISYLKHMVATLKPFPSKKEYRFKQIITGSLCALLGTVAYFTYKSNFFGSLWNKITHY
ncbi:MAG: hypothetical protein WDZ41_04305 [Candidatus Babeliales bacterium]